MKDVPLRHYAVDEPGDRNNTYTTNWSYYDYLTNQQRNDDFTFSCSVYYLVGSASESNQTTYWEDNDYYHQAWEDAGYNSGLFSDLMILTKESGMITYNSVSNYGGWDELTLDIDLRMDKFWETTEFTITILYSFTPVIPVE